MPIVSVYPNGATAHIPRNGESMHERAKRDTIQGWSNGAVRRHTKWLKSIPVGELTGFGYAVTLTVRDCPASASEFHKLRRAYLMRIDRMGAIRMHWIIEWQRRGVPHMHTAIYFTRQLTMAEQTALRQHWVTLCEDLGALLGSQYVTPISGPTGWLKYLSKHAGRGAAHYQRQGKPAGWETTGRLWGHTGQWNEREAMRFELPREDYFRYRRLVRSWRYADARAEKDLVLRRRRMLSARHMLRFNDRALSEVRGVSEWADEGWNLEIFSLLAEQGAAIRQVSTVTALPCATLGEGGARTDSTSLEVPLRLKSRLTTTMPPRMRRPHVKKGRSSSEP